MSVAEVLDVRELLEPPEDSSSISDLSASKKGKKKAKKKSIADWGFPGHLTKEEGNIYVKFRDEINKRGGEIKNTVYSFSEEEGEAYCLTRWLRARKYSYADTIAMVEEATEHRSEPRSHDYFPDATSTLGVDPSVFISQYPQLYSGFSKDGCPVFYSQTGKINITGIECITTVKSILDYHWHIMQHDYRKRLLGFKQDNPNFKRFECISIIDLAQLTVGQLNNRTLDIIKKQSFNDSLCFPETMNKTIIVNAPRFFAVTWGLIKGWLDARTVSKIEMFTSTKAAQACLREYIDEDQIPSDYGGTGEDTDTTLRKANKISGGMSRMVTELMYIRSYQTLNLTIAKGEELEINVYTRGTSGANFLVSESPSKKTIVEEVAVIHTGVDGSDPNDLTMMPTSVTLTEGGRIKGPLSVRIKGQTKGGVFGSESFLVVANFFEVENSED